MIEEDMNMIGVMVWMLLSVIAWLIAQRKHRNVWAWSIATFFCGIFTLVPLLCLKSLEDPAQFTPCSFCGEQILKVAKVCKHCNSSLS